MSAARNPWDCLRGISDDGNTFVQTKRGGGYLVLRRAPGWGWQCVAESRCYVDACALVDAIALQPWTEEDAEMMWLSNEGIR